MKTRPDSIGRHQAVPVKAAGRRIVLVMTILQHPYLRDREKLQMSLMLTIFPTKRR
jgi:hypothetical protein